MRIARALWEDRPCFLPGDRGSRTHETTGGRANTRAPPLIIMVYLPLAHAPVLVFRLVSSASLEDFR